MCHRAVQQARKGSARRLDTLDVEAQLLPQLVDADVGATTPEASSRPRTWALPEARGNPIAMARHLAVSAPVWLRTRPMAMMALALYVTLLHMLLIVCYVRPH